MASTPGYEERKERKERFDIAKLVVLSGWSLTVLACLLIIAASTYMTISAKSIEGPLKEWGGTCLGFLFGSFMSLLKDFLNEKSTS
jgi:hypothetical protein